MTFFREARLIEDHHSLRGSHIFMHQTMVRPEHLGVIPDRITDAARPRPHVPALHLEGYGFDRFAFQLTELAYHVMEEMVPGFAPRTALAKGGMKAVQFVHKAFDIAGIKRKLGDGEHVPFGPTGW
jgi:hypothetical protein